MAPVYSSQQTHEPRFIERLVQGETIKEAAKRAG